MTTENPSELMSKEVESKAGVVTFNPPVYIQRYMTVAKLLQSEPWNHRISKVVDFGCAELKLFKYLKRIENITHISAVDVDEKLILNNLYSAKPLLFEYISGFSKRLTVNLFRGTIAEPDERLMNVDAVICIELIEHLYSEVLDLVPSTIFKYLKPKLVIFTTPNADFNVLLNLKKFRHDDHKFEWTRAEFENWCSNIILDYPNYDVSFEGIGHGPEGTEHLGCCSQMAVFSLTDDDLCINTNNDLLISKPYELLYTVEYPFKEDERNDEQKFYDDVTFRISDITTSRDGFKFQRYDSKFEIPIHYLWNFLKNWCSTEEIFLEKLQNRGYLIYKNDDDLPVLVYDAYDDSGDESEESYDGHDCKFVSSMDEENWAS